MPQGAFCGAGWVRGEVDRYIALASSDSPHNSISSNLPSATEPPSAQVPAGTPTQIETKSRRRTLGDAVVGRLDSPDVISGEQLDGRSPPAESPPENVSSTDRPEPVVRTPWFDWTDRDQWTLVTLGLLVLAAIGFHWIRWRTRGVAVVDIERLPERQYEFRIDINQATWVEWMQLPGVGEILARRIVADRAARGPFSSIDHVGRVPGVGTATLDTIRPWLTCSDCKIGAAH